MAPITRDFGLGVVSADFSQDAFTAALAQLDAESVRRFKAAANTHARELSSDRDEQVERDLVTGLLAG